MSDEKDIVDPLSPNPETTEPAFVSIHKLEIALEEKERTDPEFHRRRKLLRSALNKETLYSLRQTRALTEVANALFEICRYMEVHSKKELAKLLEVEVEVIEKLLPCEDGYLK